MSFLVLQSSRWERSCFTLIVFLMPCGCLCSVTLPYGAVGWSAMYDCGISWSYSLFDQLQVRILIDYVKRAIR